MKPILCRFLGHRFISNYNYPAPTKERIDAFADSVRPYASSNEMVQTYLGRDNSWGGMVVIPWNLLIHYVHAVAGNEFCERCGKESPNAVSGEEHLNHIAEKKLTSR